MLFKIFHLSKYLNFSIVQSWTPKQMVENLKKNRTFATFRRSKRSCVVEEQSERSCVVEEQIKRSCVVEEQRPKMKSKSHFEFF